MPTRRHVLFALFLLLCFPPAANTVQASSDPLFTQAEQQWMDTHPVVTMVINHGPPPLTIVKRYENAFPPHPDGPPPGLQPPGSPPGPVPGLAPGSMPGQMPGQMQGQMQGQGNPQGFETPLENVSEDEQDEFDGLAADMVKELERVTGLRFVVTRLSTNSLRSAADALRTGEVDLMPLLLFDRMARAHFLLTDPYVDVPSVVVMREDEPHLDSPAQLKGRRVAGVLSSNTRLEQAGIELTVEHAGPREGLMGVATGKYDAFLAELSVVSHILAATPISNLKIVGEIPGSTPFGMAVSPHARELLPILNKALAAIPMERKDAVWRKWFPITYEQRLVSSGWLVTMGLASAAALLLGGTGFLYYRRRIRRIRSGLAALEPHLLCVHTDQDVTITEVTKAVYDLTGFEPQDLIGKPLSVLGTPRKGPSALDHIFNTVERGESWKGEARLVRKDGSRLWADVVISPRRRRNESEQGFTVIYQDATKRKHFEDLANRDELTGLGNKRHFNDMAPTLRDRARSEGKHFALLLMDVDHFKKYNDTYGHPAGDEVLSSIGRVLGDALQRSSDMSFRVGGEEFGTITLLDDPGDAQQAADKLLNGIRSLGMEHRHNPPGVVTMSMGVCLVAPGDERTIEQLYEAADKALYAAKDSGRDRFVIES